MPYAVKSDRTSDPERPPTYEQVSEEEVIAKERALRSAKSDTHFHQSPKLKSSDIAQLFENKPPSLSPVSDLSQSLQSLQFTPPNITATAYDLGSEAAVDPGVTWLSVID